MPILILPIPDVTHTVTRNVVQSVVQDIIELTHLPSTTRVIYPGQAEQYLQPQSAIGSPEDTKNFGNKPTFVVEVSERLLEEDAGRNDLALPENAFLLKDPELGVYLRPNYAYMEVDVTIRAIFPSRIHARQWADEVTNRLRMGRQTLVHKASYHYRFNPVHWAIVNELHRLRESNAGYGEDFEEWFEAHKNPRVTLATTQGAQYSEYVVSETMRRIQGNFGFVLTPDEGQDKDNRTSHEATVNYTFHYDKVTSMQLSYPIVVHNQLLSSKYRESETKFEEENRTELLSYSLNALRYFEAGQESYFKWRAYHGIAIPSFDDFIPKNVPLSTVRIFTGLIQLPDNQPGTQLMRFDRLGKYALKPEVLSFLKSESPYITKDYQSLFQLHLYIGWYPFNNRLAPLTVTDELTVHTNRELNYRDNHRLRFSLVTDVDLVDPDAWDRIRENSCVLSWVLEAIMPGIDVSGLVPLDGECGKVSKDQLDDILDQIRDIQQTRPKDHEVRLNTLATFFIEARRKEDAPHKPTSTDKRNP